MKALLESIREIDDEIKAIQLKISEQYNRMHNLSATDYSKDIVSGGIQTTTDDRYVTGLAKVDRMKRAIKELEEQRDEIVDCIDSLDGWRNVAVLYHRYVIGLTWEETASRMNYSRSQTIRIHDEACKQFRLKWNETHQE